MDINSRTTGRICLLFTILFVCTGTWAQDTTSLSINDADKVFLSKNLDLLAAKLNVSSQKAAEIQAKLYPNPVVSGELNVWDPQNNKVLHAGNSGQKALAVQQLILLGGKRQNEIELARQNTGLAQLELEDLLRNLKQQLHTSMYSIHIDELTLDKYNTQLQLLDTIIANYEIQAKKGNISLKEIVRLKSVYLNLNNEKTELLQNIQKEQENLKLLLQTTSDIKPVINAGDWSRFDRVPPVDSLRKLALQNRPDRKMAEQNKDIAALNLRYQRSLAVPDLTVGSAYDQAGGAFKNQVNLTVGMPLPLWHRNQGNIKMAKTQIEIAGIQQDITVNGINAEVTSAYNNMQRSIDEYVKSKEMYNADFNEVFNGITDNFRKRNISIIEFVDFFEAYNQSTAAINHVKKNVALCAEGINYATGYPVY